MHIQIPRQFALAFETEEAAAAISTALQVATIASAVVGFAAQGGMNHMWSNINSLTLIVHLPIYLVNFPANAQVLFEALIKVVTFDFLGIRDILGVESGFEFTPTSPFSENFDKLGYGS